MVAQKVEKDHLVQSILNDPLLQELGLTDVNEAEISHVIQNERLEKEWDYLERRLEREEKRTRVEGNVSGMDALERANEEIAEMAEDRDATARLTITSDRLVAKITLERPGKKGKALSEKAILEKLAQEGIVKGIEHKYISRLEKYPVYGVPFQIAIGKAAVDGKDGYIVPCFENENENEHTDMTKEMIDFKTVGFINQVKEGQLLCDIVLPLQGEEGYDIFGTVLKTKHGSITVAANGTNTYFSEDQLQLFAGCAGHAYLKDGIISVQKVMSVADVDYTTGNITFSGDVTVKGDVKNGFFVRSGGNIVIEGNVEENVDLQARGDIVIRKGVNGKGGSIRSEGSLQVGFLQYATINVKENITADSIINCQITCGGHMHLVGKNGQIVGGEAKIGGSLTGKEMGNVANISTEIEMIGPYLLSNEKADLEAKIAKCEETVKQLEILMKNISGNQEGSTLVENRKNILKTMVAKRQMEEEITVLMAQANAVGTAIPGKTVGDIRVTGNLYSNVHINIDGTFFHNSTMKNNRTIYKKDNKIAIS